MVRWMAATALPLLVAAAPPGATGVQAEVDAALERAVEEGRIVGAVVLIARDGETIYRRAIGAADRELGVPMREDAIFRLASATKPIVSAAALSLVEEGRIGLDDPVTKWLPAFRPALEDGTRPTITIRHLLTHTAGLGYDFLQPEDGSLRRAGVSNGLDGTGLGAEENLRRLAGVPLQYRPGEGWGYSMATDVLGEAIARAAGVPLPDLVRARVTDQLGMRDTDSRVGAPERLATAYAHDGRGAVRMGARQGVSFGATTVFFEPWRSFDPASFPSGGAGMVGTAGDYLRFLEALRRGGAPILGRASVEGMTTNQIGDLPVSTEGPGYGFGHGFGVLLDPAAAQDPASKGTFHWGGAYGLGYFVDPAERLSVVVFSNTAFIGMVELPREVRAAIYRGLAAEGGAR